MSKIYESRVIMLLLIITLLVSISYLALEISIYIEGRWQLVQSAGFQPIPEQRNPFAVQTAEKDTYPQDYWTVVSEGELFFKPLSAQPVTQQPIVVPQTPTVKESPKPTCPWVNMGVMIGNPSLAILTNGQSQKSEIVKVGTRLGDYEVLEITVGYVLVRSSEAEFKLEVGGM